MNGDFDTGEAGVPLPYIENAARQRRRRILLLAGTAEARNLAVALSREPYVIITVSLARPERIPHDFGWPVRIGGWGGEKSYRNWLIREGIDMVIDATHPFADEMSKRTVKIAPELGIEAVRFMRHAEKVGADAALIVTPYYNKPTQGGLIRHFTALHDCCTLPIIIYNIPPRSVIDMTPETMGELSKLPRIIGVKDATGDLSRVPDLLARCGPDFAVYSGDDPTAMELMLAGGHGNIIATLFGAMTVAVVQNGLNLNAVPAAWQNITLGIIILLAVGFDMWRNDIGKGFSKIFAS